MLRRTTIAFAVVTAISAGSALPARASTTSRIYIMRAIPNLASVDNVNLCVNGTRRSSKMQPGWIAGPFAVHTRRVRVKLTKDQAPCRSSDRRHVILQTTFRERSGSKSTLIAGLHPNGGHFDHRCGAGECEFTKYKNVGSHTEKRDTRINVVHVADTGASPVDSAVNVSFRGARRVHDLRNNGRGSPPLDLRAGPLRWAITGAAGTTKAGQVLASGRFSARRAHAYTLILWGPQNGRYHVQLMDRQVRGTK